MKSFTYDDYIECIHKLRLNEIFRIAEEGIDYKIKEENEEIGKLLINKKEVNKIINKLLKTNNKIDEKNLIKWESKYILKKYKSKKPAVIYKQKREQTFFLIDQAKEINNSLKYRILNYCIDIIYDWTKEHKKGIKSKYPKVIPIIIYTGKDNYDTNNKKSKISIINQNKSLSFRQNDDNFSNQIFLYRRKKSIGDYIIENYKVDIPLNIIKLKNNISINSINHLL